MSRNKHDIIPKEKKFLNATFFKPTTFIVTDKMLIKALTF